jgi:hypothetical protein
MSYERSIAKLGVTAGLLILPGSLAAQGLPVETGSQIPLALWFAGAAVLGIAIAYGIMRNRNRTPAEKKLTDDATEANYAATERDRVKRRDP